MFGFSNRKNEYEVRDLLARLINQTAPNLGTLEGDDRRDSRSNRTLPVILVVWENGRPNPKETTSVVTKDVSDRGISVVLRAPLRVDKLVVALFVPRERQDPRTGEPAFALAEVRQHCGLGGGFWQTGLEFTELLSVAKYPELEQIVPLVTKLTPPVVVPLPSADSLSESR